MSQDTTSLLYDLFADLLVYPGSAAFQQAKECVEEQLQGHPEAAGALQDFCRGLEMRSPGQIEELYTITFDMQPVCYPYVGYHLFGESYKRGAFMAQLNEAYHACGFSAGQELPDHLSVILRFLGLDPVNREGNFCHVLLNEGLLPALAKMLQAFGGRSENPYFGLLSALHLLLLQNPEKELGHA